MDAKCSFCNSKILPGDATVSCPKCEIPYHPDCLANNGGKCSIYGCGKVAVVEAKEIVITDEDRKKANKALSNLCLTSWLIASPPILYVLLRPSVTSLISSCSNLIQVFFTIFVLIFAVGSIIDCLILLVKIILNPLATTVDYIQNKMAAKIARERLTSQTKK